MWALVQSTNRRASQANVWKKYNDPIIHDLRLLRDSQHGNLGVSAIRHHEHPEISAAMQHIEIAALSGEKISVESVKKARRSARKLLRARSSSG